MAGHVALPEDATAMGVAGQHQKRGLRALAGFGVDRLPALHPAKAGQGVRITLTTLVPGGPGPGWNMGENDDGACICGDRFQLGGKVTGVFVAERP